MTNDVPNLQFKKSTTYLNTQLALQANNAQLLTDLVASLGLSTFIKSNKENYNTLDLANEYLSLIDENEKTIKNLILNIDKISNDFNMILKNPTIQSKEFYITNLSSLKETLTDYTKTFQDLEIKLDIDNIKINSFLEENHFDLSNIKTNLDENDKLDYVKPNSINLDDIIDITDNVVEDIEDIEDIENITVDDINLDDINLDEINLDNVNLDDVDLTDIEINTDDVIIDTPEETILEDDTIETANTIVNLVTYHNLNINFTFDTVPTPNIEITTPIKVEDFLTNNIKENEYISTSKLFISPIEKNKENVLINSFEIANKVEPTNIFNASSNDILSLINGNLKPTYAKKETSTKLYENTVLASDTENTESIKTQESLKNIVSKLDTIPTSDSELTTNEIIDIIDEPIIEENLINTDDISIEDLENIDDFNDDSLLNELLNNGNIDDISLDDISLEDFDLESVPEEVENNEEIIDTVKEETPISPLSSIEEKIQKIQEAKFDNETLLISERTNTIYLPYKISDLKGFLKAYPETYKTLQDVVDDEYTIPFEYFSTNPSKIRFKEAYNLYRNRSDEGLFTSLFNAFKLSRNSKLDPSVIAACHNVADLETYLNYLEANKLDKFKLFKIIHDVCPVLN